METLGDRVKAERETREWSQAELAKRVVRAGFKSMSQVGIQKIETKGHSQPKCIVELASALGLNARWLQTGRGEKYAKNQIRLEADLPVMPPSKEIVSVNELDVHAFSGMGADVDSPLMAADEAGAILGTYTFPASGFREAYGAQPNSVRILTVRGDSNIPMLWPGQKVMVDIADKSPSPPGVFVVWDGLGLVIKRVEVVAGSDPLKVRISSANPAYLPYERTLEEAHINGRVIGNWARM